MEEAFSENVKRREPSVSPSSEKAMRVMLLAILLQVSWPKCLKKEEIFQRLPYYGDHPLKAFQRDLKTLADCPLEDLPDPTRKTQEELDLWCAEQQRRGKLTITYDRENASFGLMSSLFTFDINEDEARAFLALKEGFSPGTPYADAVQFMLRRWEWLFSERSHMLIQRKSRRTSRPVYLPLSPATDYSKHKEVILFLDAALEGNILLSFAYTPLTKSWNDSPVEHTNIEPYELEYRDGHWYFTAYVAALGKFLDYRVDRIRPGSQQLGDDPFSPGRKRPEVKIRYWVAPEMARHGTLSARLREQKVGLLDAYQGAIVEGYARSLWWATKLLLGYGDQVRALEPPELVQQMREIVRSMYQQYWEG